MRRRFGPLLLTATLAAVLCTPAAARAKKKLSLAELAALEWKLEQGSNTLVSASDAADRKKAVADLAALDDPRTARPLARALKEDPVPEVRLAAAEAIAELRSPEAKGLLKLAASSDPDPRVRETAEQLLKKMPRRMKAAALPLKERKYSPPKGKITAKTIQAVLASPSGDARLWAVKRAAASKRMKGRTKVLKRRMTSDPSARVRVAAARGLAKALGKKALPALIKAAGDGNPFVRFEVARLLAEYDDAGALAVLQRLAASDDNPKVQAEAKDLMEPTTPVGKRLLEERIKKLRSNDPAQRVAALKELAAFTHWRAMHPMSCTLLNDESSRVRSTAAKVLTDMHDTSVLTALRVAAMLEPDRKVRKLVRGLLTGLRRRVDGLIQQLQSGEPSERALAARALGQGAYPPGLDPLIKALKDKDPKVRLAAVRGLQSFSAPKASTALKSAGTDSDPRVRKAVDAYFKKQRRLKKYHAFFGDPNRVAMKTQDKSAVWRGDAAVALGISGADSAVGTIARLLLHDKNEEVRLAAAWALVLMASQRAEAALKKAAAEDPSEEVRLTARKYLVIDKVSLDDLLKQLEDDSAQVRQDAAEALSLKPRGRTLYPMVRAAMCDPEPAVRKAAMRGLARMGNPLAKTAIRVAMTRDPSKDVRRVAYMMYILAGGK
jgi:HEAT repeat protein